MKKTLLVAGFCIWAGTNLQADLLIQSGTVSAGTQYNTGVDGSVAGGEANVVLTPPHPAWASAINTSQWISFINNYSPTPGGQTACTTGVTDPICNGDYVDFFATFTLTNAASYSGLLQVMADDTAGVWLNGVSLFPAVGPYTGSYPDSYATCADVPVGCELNTEGVASIAGSMLQEGANTLEFQVWQRDGTGFGLDYSMSLSNTPEPGFAWPIAAVFCALLAFAARFPGRIAGRR